jgi:hypothetical protein
MSLNDDADDHDGRHVPTTLLPEGDRLLPPASYRVITDEELIEGLSFPAYRRISTAFFVPPPSGSAVEMAAIDPADLQAAQDQDAAMPDSELATAREF